MKLYLMRHAEAETSGTDMKQDAERRLTEGGRLQPIGAYPDGTINTYRIVDPRQFILSATFDL